MRAYFALFSAVASVVVACSSTPDSTGFADGAPDPSRSTPGSGNDPGTTLGGTDKTCTPACGPAERCSSLGQCIPAGACAVNADCPSGQVCDASVKQCKPGGECGAVKVAAEPVAPNVMLTLDRSCSMKKLVEGTQSTKWQVAVASINKMTKAFKGQLRFGLTMFPDTKGQACLQEGPVPVPVGVDKESAVQKVLTDALGSMSENFPDGPCVTNIDTGLDQASKDPALADKTRAGYVILLSDGAQAGCNAAGGDNGATSIITDLHTRGIKTFVIGFGSGSDGAQLNVFATAGGTPASTGATKYYQAENGAALEAALKSIASKAISCELALKETPPDPAKLYVFAGNGASIARDASHATGWDYDAAGNRVVFYGSTCQDLKDGKLAGLDLVFGCATVPAK